MVIIRNDLFFTLKNLIKKDLKQRKKRPGFDQFLKTKLNSFNTKNDSLNES